MSRPSTDLSCRDTHPQPRQICPKPPQKVCFDRQTCPFWKQICPGNRMSLCNISIVVHKPSATTAPTPWTSGVFDFASCRVRVKAPPGGGTLVFKAPPKAPALRGYPSSYTKQHNGFKVFIPYLIKMKIFSLQNSVNCVNYLTVYFKSMKNFNIYKF